MCEMIDRFIEQGRSEGIAQGRTEGIAQGRSEGIAQGVEKGKLSMLYELTKDGVLTLAEAAKRAGMSEKAFLAGIP